MIVKQKLRDQPKKEHHETLSVKADFAVLKKASENSLSLHLHARANPDFGQAFCFRFYVSQNQAVI